ncbi:MAG: metallophosphoesterase [Candidatus Thorarchaeota archaeon]
MKILVTGDIHGEFGRLNNLINKKSPDIIICCGDFGYWPNVKWCNPLTNIKLQGAKKLLFCDGNHEDHWSLRERKSDELAPNIFYMPRGSTYQLDDGRTIMFMGGAHSIDKDSRFIGFDWFPEETISQRDLIDLPEVKVDIFITHTCPTELLHDMLKYDNRKRNDPSNHALSELWRIYKPSLWFFGHWHKYATGVMMGTRWYALSAPGFNDKWWMWLP